METISLPSKINWRESDKPHTAVLTIEPFFPGYGITVGNALRRVLLSSMPGAAVIAVKIAGVGHEFSTLPNVKEDIIEVVLNLKQLRVKTFSEEPVTLNLKVKGEKIVKAKDIEKNSAAEIINPDLVLATLTSKDAELAMEIIVGQGRGYLPAENQILPKEIGLIAIDSVFTPVLNVIMKIESVRVGQMTNYDKLVLEIVTNGIITPQDAFKQAVAIILEHFNFLAGNGEDKKTAEEPAPSPVLETASQTVEETATEAVTKKAVKSKEPGKDKNKDTKKSGKDKDRDKK